MSNDNNNAFFEDDDEETLDLLVSSSAEVDMETYLVGLAGRFREDANECSDGTFWRNLSTSAEELGFRTPSALASSQAPPDGGHTAFPAAFETDSGKKHIRATSSLLRVSETRAVQLTLSALRALNGGDDAQETHVQSLLGTRDLLRTVRDHHFRQRLSRLQVITECLRIEQDDSALYHDDAMRFLDDLDKNFVMEERNRGLFRRLLTVACAPYAPPSREELLPTLDLRSELPESLQSAQLRYSEGDGDVASDRLVTDCIQATRSQALRERREAMEAILVLLYSRIDQGIRRVDYVLLLLAFQSRGTFFTAEGTRLSHLSGLVCAECMSLWLTASTETTDSGAPQWLLRHPMLVGVLESEDTAARELETIRVLLVKYASQVPGRKLLGLAGRTAETAQMGDEHVADAPESIALLSFALLLRLTSMNMPRTGAHQSMFDFDKHAMECAQVASDECGAFAYLHATMEALVSTPVRDSFSSCTDTPYDWQLSGGARPFLLEGPTEQDDLNAATVAYTSIALEVLSSTIIAFKSTIRSGNCISTENVAMLCGLAGTIYGNHPVICEGFWRDIGSYSATAASEEHLLAPKHALCYLMDAAHASAASALNLALTAVEGQPGLEENILPSLVPLLQLVSSLCSSSDMLESVLNILPKGMIRTSLLYCAPTGAVADEVAFSKSVLHVLESIQTLARVGESSNCRIKLLSALEEEGSDTMDGPRMLYRILAKHRKPGIVGSALRIIGYLVENATGHELWVTKAMKYFGNSGLGESGLPALLTGQSDGVTLSGLHVLSGFVNNMATAAFCPLCPETDILDVIDIVFKGVTVGCTILSSVCSLPSSYFSRPDNSTFRIAHGVLRSVALFLREIRPVINTHASFRVRSAAQEARDLLVQTLATSTSIGQAIAHFASAPVSLSLAIALEEALQHSKVLQLASDEHGREEDPKEYGAWRSVLHGSGENETAIGIARVRAHAQNLVSNIHDIDIDMTAFRSRGWTNEGNETEPLQAASAALDVIRQWALHVDAIVAEQHGGGEGKETNLSQSASSDLRALSPYRLIFCQAVKPPLVEVSAPLSKVWPTERLCVLDLIIRYLPGSDEEEVSDGSTHGALPALMTADVVSLSLIHAKHAESCQALQIPVAEMVIRCKAELLGGMVQSIKNAVGIATASGQNGELPLEENRQVRHGLASLHLLRTCMDFDQRVVIAFCGSSDHSSLLDEITDVVKAFASSMSNMGSLEQLSADAVSTSQLRMASASIDVLLSLWKSSQNPSKKASAEIFSIIDAIKRNVVTDLVSIITQFSRNGLLSQDPPSEVPSSMHLASVCTAATSRSLEILLIELSREFEVANSAYEGTRRLVKDLMGDSFSSLFVSFSRLDGAVAAARSSSSFTSYFKSFRYVSVHEPSSVLCSFPAVYRSQLAYHESKDDNLCDIVAACRWLSSPHRMADTSDAYDLLESANASQILLSSQLALVSSWGRFALMYSSGEKCAEDQTDREFLGEQALLMASTVLDELDRIAVDLEQAQMIFSENFLSLDGGRVAYALAGLLLEMISKNFRLMDNSAAVGHRAARVAIIGMLEQLRKTEDKLFSATYPLRPARKGELATFASYPSRTSHSAEKLQEESLQICCSLHQRLLAVAMLCTMTLDKTCPSNEVSIIRQPAETQLTEILLGFVGVACKGLGLVDILSNSNRSDVIMSRRKYPISRQLLHTCVSLLTTLLSRERAAGTTVTGDKLYYANAAASLKRFDVINSLVVHVNAASNLACSPSHSTNVRMEGTCSFIADENEVRIVQSIFTFVRTIAEVGKKSPDMLSTLSSAALTKMLVDNSLLTSASRHWISLKHEDGRGDDKGSSHLRGYLPAAGKLPIETQRGEAKTIVGGPFLSGRDDPTHAVWRTALQILQATVNAYSEPGDKTSLDAARGGFFDTATDFLRAHYSSLLDCLEQCASLPFDHQRVFMSNAPSSTRAAHAVLTFNVLRESADILSLVSALCSGIHLHRFENTCSEIYHGMTQASHTVLRGLTKFLGASGTARETFAALKEYDLELKESANREQVDFGYGFIENGNIHPLLSAGIPNARHEAIKHAHYASRCCAFVTSADYDGLPAASDTNVASPLSTSSLEQDCQLSMNSPFIIRMEHAAAECVFQAVSVLSETHPASASFVMFSADEAARLDSMSLLRADMIMAVRPEPTSSAVARFCRILQVDTVRRLCHVRYLDETGSLALATVTPDRVAGVEDMKKRKPILTYSAAPDSAAALDSEACSAGRTATLGDLIISLRWCVQYSGGSIDFDKSKTIRKTLAESASALLSTEISLHGEIGAASKSDRNESSKRLLAQLLQLYDEPPGQSEDGVLGRRASLKTIIGTSVWHCIQRQLEDELRLARNDRTEKRLRMAKSADETNASSPWFNSSRRHGGSMSFQGLGFSTR